MIGLTGAAARPDPGAIARGAAMASVLVLLALWIGHAPLIVPVIAAVSLALFLAALLSPGAGLVLLVASMLLSPEIPIAGLGGSDLEGGRSIVLRADDLVLLIVALGWIARVAIRKDRGALRRTPLDLPILAWIGACAVATLLGIGAGRVRPILGLCFLLKYVEYVLVFFITVNHVRTAERLRCVLVALLATAAVIAGWAIAQIPSGQRPSAPFEGGGGEPNTLGGYLVLLFCIAAGIALSRPTVAWTRWTRLLALVLIVPILATLSRGSWIALAAGLVTLLLLSPARRGLSAAVLVGVVLLLTIPPQMVVDRVSGTFESGTATRPIGPIHLDPSATARLESWGAALEGWLRHPIAGWGITGYGFIDAHYFRLLVEIGLIGIAAFAWLVREQARLFFGLFRSARLPLHRGLAMGLVAGLVALLAHGISANTFMLIRIMEPFWLLAGLAAAVPAVETPA